MNTVQPQIRNLHRAPVNVGGLLVQTVDIKKLVPSNDARQCADYRTHTTRKLLAIVAMLSLISYLVWNLG